jgi:hypothetical protein
MIGGVGADDDVIQREEGIVGRDSPPPIGSSQVVEESIASIAKYCFCGCPEQRALHVQRLVASNRSMGNEGVPVLDVSVIAAPGFPAATGAGIGVWKEHTNLC